MAGHQKHKAKQHKPRPCPEPEPEEVEKRVLYVLEDSSSESSESSESEEGVVYVQRKEPAKKVKRAHRVVYVPDNVSDEEVQ